MAEQFKYRKIITFHTVLNAVYPLALLIGSIAIGVIASDSQYLSLAWWYPLFITGTVGWLAYSVVNIIKDISFCVEVTDRGITVKGAPAQWGDIIEHTENDKAIGKDPAIKLELKDGTILKIPAGLDGLPYVRGVITANLEQPKTSQTTTV